MIRRPWRNLIVLFALGLVSLLADAQSSPEDPLAPLARLVGGEWRGRFKMPDGGGFEVRNVFEWGLEGKIVQARYYATVDGTERLVYVGAFAWHPTKKKIILQEYSSRGALVEGTVEGDENGLLFHWSQHSTKGSSHYREKFHFPDNDHYITQAYQKNEQGGETMVIEGVFERVKAVSQSDAGAATWERALRKQVTVDAPLAEVWKAWTTTEGVTTFFGPEAKVEATLGGPYEIYFGPTEPIGMRGSEGCKVQSVVPMKLLAFEWNAPPTIPAVRNSGVHTLVYIQLEELGTNQTRVTMTHTGWGVGDDWDKTYAYFDRAWDAVLSNLRYRFAVGPVQWPGRFIRAEFPPARQD